MYNELLKKNCSKNIYLIINFTNKFYNIQEFFIY